LSNDGGEGRVYVTFTGGFDDNKLLTQRGGGNLRVARVELRDCIPWVYEKADRIGLGNQFTQQREPLRHQHLAQGGNAGDISLRSIEAANKSESDRVATGIKNDRNRRGRRLGRDRCGNAGRDCLPSALMRQI
jgi:hypothetical protein